MSNKEHICPITNESIKVYGMTCYGNIYEYDAIKKWFENNDCDPLFNLVCPTLFVVKLQNYKIENLEETQRSARLSLDIWCHILKNIRHSEKFYENMNKIKIINNINGWKEYNEMKRKRFIKENQNTHISIRLLKIIQSMIMVR